MDNTAITLLNSDSPFLNNNMAPVDTLEVAHTSILMLWDWRWEALG